ncbi:MAG: DUF4129 domain-containing protein [Syntrophobacterales bacterium]|jgi:hypothetical protein
MKVRFKRISIPSALSLAMLLLFLAGGAKGWAKPLSVNEYHTLVQESLTRLKEKTGEMQPDERSRLGESFPPDLMIWDMDGELAPVDRKGLIYWAEEAENSPRGREQLIAYLEALIHQVSWETAEISLAGSSWEESRSLLNEVYRGREFKHLRKRKEPAWQESVRKLLERLSKWLEDHLGFLGGVRGKWLQHTVNGLVFLLGAILIIWIFRSFGPVGWRWKFPRASSTSSAEGSPDKDWGAWREEAHSKAHEGRFREAIRFLFISVLVEGHQKGWWVYESEATNREHLAQVDDQAERREALQRLIDRYEKAWYGLGHPGKEEFQHCEQLVHQMEITA